MTSQNILSWNCRGFFAHYEEFEILKQNYNPIAFCFQETKLKSKYFPTFRNYDAYVCNCDSDTVAKGGVMTLVLRDFSSNKIDIDTRLEAVAVRLYCPLKFTLCNVYLRGSDNITFAQMDRLIEQLEPPFMLTGDLTGEKYNLCVFNKVKPKRKECALSYKNGNR
jgi:exonuclease III